MVQTLPIEQQEAIVTTAGEEPMSIDAKTSEVKREEAKILTPEEMRKAVKDYLTLPDVRENLLTWAKHLLERFRGNWFDFEQVLKKTPLKDANSAKGVLDMLILSGLCHREVKPKGVVKFKICLEKGDKVALLEKEAEDLKQQRDAILREIEALSTEVAA